MALMDTLRLRNIFVRNGIAEDEAAGEVVGALDEEMSAATEHFVTKDSHEASESRVVAALADLERRQAQRDAARAERDAERDHQIHNHITIGIGLIIGAITIATAVISIVIVVLD